MLVETVTCIGYLGGIAATMYYVCSGTVEVLSGQISAGTVRHFVALLYLGVAFICS